MCVSAWVVYVCVASFKLVSLMPCLYVFAVAFVVFLLCIRDCKFV